MDPKTSTVYCLESRPKDEGRGVLVRVGHYDLTNPEKGWNVRTGVHEYGGAAATVFGGTAYFSNYSLGDKIDGRVYKVLDNGSGQVPDPTPITPGEFPRKLRQVDADFSITLPENNKHRFAGLAVYPKDPRFIVAILEDHTKDEPRYVANMLCVINAEAETMNIIVKGQDPTRDFYGPPAFSPGGVHIAWQQWSHPDMPWDQAKIYIADVSTDSTASMSFKDVRAVAFQATRPVSLAYPNWSNDNTLLFTSDVSGFVNPWKYDILTGGSSAVFSKTVDQDFGCPMWSLHFFPFAVLDEQRALFIGSEDGHDSLYSVDLNTPGLPTKLNTGCVVIDGLRSLGNGKVVFAGTKVDEGTKIINCTVLEGRDGSLRASVTNFESEAKEAQSVSKDWISTPTTPPIQGYYGSVHVVYYAPKNPNYSGPTNEKPPCIVHVHGGPESLQPQGLDWTKQYFTSRGWAW